MRPATLFKAAVACGAFLLGTPAARAQVTAEGWAPKKGFNLPAAGSGQKYQGMPYTLFIPFDYFTSDPSVDYPVLVYLHGAFDGTMDGTGAYYHGIGSYLSDPANIDVKRAFPYFVVFPQSVPTYLDANGNTTDDAWDSDRGKVTGILTQLKNRYRIDPSRVVLTGFSRGARAVWQLADETTPTATTDWAAVVTAEGWCPGQPDLGDATPLSADQVAALRGVVRTRGIPCYLLHSTRDTYVPVAAVETYPDAVKTDALVQSGDVAWDFWPGADHTGADLEAYGDPTVYDWIWSRLYP